MRTYEEVKKTIKEKEPEVIEDIQRLLELACCNNCVECGFQYICIRDREE